jgi:hypothetical protein
MASSYEYHLGAMLTSTLLPNMTALNEVDGLEINANKHASRKAIYFYKGCALYLQKKKQSGRLFTTLMSTLLLMAFRQ